MPISLLRLGLTPVLAAFLSLILASSATAQKIYDPGATDTEIKVGNIMPYSGPASSYATIGKTEAAYFNKLNAGGGINGRKIDFISYDDGYSPPKAVEQARKLVESDEVLLIFNSLGTPSNSARRNSACSAGLGRTWRSSASSVSGSRLRRYQPNGSDAAPSRKGMRQPHSWR